MHVVGYTHEFMCHGVTKYCSGCFGRLQYTEIFSHSRVCAS